MKHSKAFTDGSFVRDCMIQAAKFICPEKMQLFGGISLSRNTVSQRINEMADNLSEQLYEVSATVLCFSITIDESIDIQDVAQVAVFFRGCDENIKITEELLEMIHMHRDTTGESV